jgi:AraC family transcriptional activator of pobA
MKDTESLEDFYRRKFDRLPEEIRQGVGHFNMFHLEPYVEGKPTAIPYSRRDFYKIMLVKGNSHVHYADRVVQVEKQALTFSNPQIPYKWEHLDRIRDGVYCIFDRQFFHQFGQFQQYEVFQPHGTHVFELNDAQAAEINRVYERMEKEFSSDYKYRYDMIRNLIFELLHFALKLEPSTQAEEQSLNASRRISMLFMELLERQFPIDDMHKTVELRSASDFATQLNVHVNHLNRAVKGTTQRTTTEHISGRILQESKALLKSTSWNVSEIAYALGFTEPTHFNNFFKKHEQTSPTRFRKV